MLCLTRLTKTKKNIRENEMAHLWGQAGLRTFGSTSTVNSTTLRIQRRVKDACARGYEFTQESTADMIVRGGLQHQLNRAISDWRVGTITMKCSARARTLSFMAGISRETWKTMPWISQICRLIILGSEGLEDSQTLLL